MTAPVNMTSSSGAVRAPISSTGTSASGSATSSGQKRKFDSTPSAKETQKTLNKVQLVKKNHTNLANDLKDLQKEMLSGVQSFEDFLQNKKRRIQIEGPVNSAASAGASSASASASEGFLSPPTDLSALLDSFQFTMPPRENNESSPLSPESTIVERQRASKIDMEALRSRQLYGYLKSYLLTPLTGQNQEPLNSVESHWDTRFAGNFYSMRIQIRSAGNRNALTKLYGLFKDWVLEPSPELLSGTLLDLQDLKNLALTCRHYYWAFKKEITKESMQAKIEQSKCILLFRESLPYASIFARGVSNRELRLINLIYSNVSTEIKRECLGFKKALPIETAVKMLTRKWCGSKKEQSQKKEKVEAVCEALFLWIKAFNFPLNMLCDSSINVSTFNWIIDRIIVDEDTDTKRIFSHQFLQWEQNARSFGARKSIILELVNKGETELLTKLKTTFPDAFAAILQANINPLNDFFNQLCYVRFQYPHRNTVINYDKSVDMSIAFLFRSGLPLPSQEFVQQLYRNRFFETLKAVFERQEIRRVLNLQNYILYALQFSSDRKQALEEIVKKASDSPRSDGLLGMAVDAILALSLKIPAESMPGFAEAQDSLVKDLIKLGLNPRETNIQKISLLNVVISKPNDGALTESNSELFAKIKVLMHATLLPYYKDSPEVLEMVLSNQNYNKEQIEDQLVSLIEKGANINYFDPAASMSVFLKIINREFSKAIAAVEKSNRLEPTFSNMICMMLLFDVDRVKATQQIVTVLKDQNSDVSKRGPSVHQALYTLFHIPNLSNEKIQAAVALVTEMIKMGFDPSIRMTAVPGTLEFIPSASGDNALELILKNFTSSNQQSLMLPILDLVTSKLKPTSIVNINSDAYYHLDTLLKIQKFKIEPQLFSRLRQLGKIGMLQNFINSAEARLKLTYGINSYTQTAVRIHIMKVLDSAIDLKITPSLSGGAFASSVLSFIKDFQAALIRAYLTRDQASSFLSIERIVDELCFAFNIDQANRKEGRAQEIINRFLALPDLSTLPNPRVIFGGGYLMKNRFGHAVLYNIQRGENGTFTFTVINTGEGSPAEVPKLPVASASSSSGSGSSASASVSSGAGSSSVPSIPVPPTRPKVYDVVYTGLTAADLSLEFINMLLAYNEVTDKPATMAGIYLDIRKKLFKGNNYYKGRVHSTQRRGSCPVKCISSWLHGRINEMNFRGFKSFYTGREISLFESLISTANRELLKSIFIVADDAELNKVLKGMRDTGNIIYQKRRNKSIASQKPSTASSVQPQPSSAAVVPPSNPVVLAPSTAVIPAPDSAVAPSSNSAVLPNSSASSSLSVLPPLPPPPLRLPPPLNVASSPQNLIQPITSVSPFTT